MKTLPTIDDIDECAGIAGSPYFTYAVRNEALAAYTDNLENILKNLTSTEFDEVAEAVSRHIQQFMAIIKDRSEYREFRTDLIEYGVCETLDLLAEKAVAVDNVRAVTHSPTVQFVLAAREEKNLPPWRDIISHHIDSRALLEDFYCLADNFGDIPVVRMTAIRAYDEVATITMRDLLLPVDQREANELFMHIARQAISEPELQECALKYGVAGIRNPERHL